MEKNQGRVTFPLDLRDFFEYYDDGDPYHQAAISQLNQDMPKELLTSTAEWFHTWSQGGRR